MATKLLTLKLDVISKIFTGLLTAAGWIFAAGTLLVAWFKLRLDKEGLVATRLGAAAALLNQAAPLAGQEKQVMGTIGGIYAIEGISLDSRSQFWVCVEILSAFVRGERPKPDDSAGAVYVWEASYRLDVLVALRVLGRMHAADQKPLRPGDKIDIRKTDLRGGEFWGYDLREADMYGCDLSGAKFQEAKLQKSKLAYANLSGANMKLAKMDEAELRGAVFAQTDLDRATFTQAKIAGADFTAAVNLVPGQLDDVAEWDVDTKVPPGIELPPDKRVLPRSSPAPLLQWRSVRNDLPPFANP